MKKSELDKIQESYFYPKIHSIDKQIAEIVDKIKDIFEACIIRIEGETSLEIYKTFYGRSMGYSLPNYSVYFKRRSKIKFPNDYRKFYEDLSEKEKKEYEKLLEELTKIGKYSDYLIECFEGFFNLNTTKKFIKLNFPEIYENL